MATFYTKTQVDEQASAIGQRIKQVSTNLQSYADNLALTVEERAKLAALESSKYLGTYLTSAEIPVSGAIPGNYADVDGGLNSVVERWIFDDDSKAFVKSEAAVGGETAASVKAKYEDNANTNVFTDAEKAKLAALTQSELVLEAATGIESFMAAFNTALTTV